MPVIKLQKESNLWDQICAEFAAKRSLTEEDDIRKQPLDSVNIDQVYYDPSIHSAVFCNYSHTAVPIDDPRQIQFDPQISHPALIGYALNPIENVEKPSDDKKSVDTKIAPTPKQMPTIDYLEKLVYPTLLPAIEQLLVEAEKNKCLERKRCAFNACDFLTRYLYHMNQNRLKIDDKKEQQKPSRILSETMTLEEIPFVRTHLEKYPRPPLPKSLIWTEEEAALKIQSYFRGYRVRKQSDIQELRIWQQEWRDMGKDIHEVVNDFWEHQQKRSLSSN
ncbi:unnamed protein product [Didymodactylos carnosus]|uniref:Uncharacterized protein n=1 Tax=Didymodactylos carnosus TaxID=1234261 RepID=A0A8S2F334_9BILA|nr:unnamed protein product [Didymodactylos carnosus]CAF4137600.1 unnamed protein product [Didymodactylos carnosus]